MTDYRIQVRNAALELVAEIDDYQKLQLVLVFNDVSKWRLSLPSDAAADAGLLEEGAGLTVTADGTTLLSGSIDETQRTWDERTGALELTGFDDTQVLGWRICLPEAPAETYATNPYDVRTGIASTVMGDYVLNNAGTAAVLPRQVAGLAIGADPLAGGTITARARFERLLDKLQELALMASSELGFRVVQSGGSLEFQVYEPIDRTDAVIFSPELGNLSHYVYSVQAPTANYAYVGGGDEGTSRTIQPGQDPASVVRWGRREVFVDQRSTSNAAELQQKASEALAKTGAATSLDVTTVDTEGLSYPAGYGLGDLVLAVIEGETIDQIVRQVQVTLEGGKSAVVIPTLASPSGPRARQGVIGLLASLRRRSQNLEIR